MIMTGSSSWASGCSGCPATRCSPCGRTRTPNGLPFDLLTDHWPHGAIARAYGIFDEQAGCALRASFVLDAEGVISWRVVNGIGEAREMADLLAALAA